MADRRRRIPVADGNLHLPMHQTSHFGECSHCGLALLIAWNGDAGETWVRLDIGLPAANVGRINIGISRSNQKSASALSSQYQRGKKVVSASSG